MQKPTCLINDYRSTLNIKKIETFAVNPFTISDISIYVTGTMHRQKSQKKSARNQGSVKEIEHG